jgi:hypothetical protein
VFSFDEFSAAIFSRLQTPVAVTPALNLPGTRPVKDPTAAPLKLVANSTTVFRIMEEKGCGQIQYYRDNATQDGMEPVWRGLLSWAKVCEDGDEVAKELTALHPYDETRMAAKLAEIKGPYPCAKMDSENPGVCTSCVHWGVITNPLINGRKIKTDNTEKEITLTPEQILQEEDEDDAPVVLPAVMVRPEPPRGFSYGENGGIYCEREEKDPQTKKKVIKQFEVLPYDLFVVFIQLFNCFFSL